jgi:hypothetical protein
MKKLLVCGMLLAFLTSVSFAQRGRAIGGVGATASPGARFPSVTPASPAARTNPNSISTGHDGALPNATKVEKDPTTVKPNATSNRTFNPVGPEPVTGPDTVTMPDAHTGQGPDR